MPSIEEVVRIDSPIENVSAYLSDPENHLHVLPSLTEIRNVSELPNGGHEGEYTFKLLEVDMTGTFRDIEIVPLERRVYEMTGDIEAEVTYEFETVNGKTRFMLILEYEPFHTRLLDKITRRMADKYFQREVRNAMDNVKMILESGDQHTGSHD